MSTALMRPPLFGCSVGKSDQLVTADKRLGRAPGLKCDVESLGNPGAVY
jgi:hypothetical protein